MSVKGSDSRLPPAPPYEATPPPEPADDVEWLVGTFTQKRYTEILHNINPSGGISELDTLFTGAVDGLGPFSIQVQSDAVSHELGPVCRLVG